MIYRVYRLHASTEEETRPVARHVEQLVCIEHL